MNIQKIMEREGWERIEIDDGEVIQVIYKKNDISINEEDIMEG